MDARGATTAGPRARPHLARRRRARGRGRPASASAPPDSATRPRWSSCSQLEPLVVGRLAVRGRARLGVDVPRDAQHRPPRRRPARDQRRRHRALGPVREAARRPGLRAARRQDAALAPRLRELALRDGGPRRARRRGRARGRRRASRPSSSGFRTARSRGSDGIRRNVELVRTVVDAVGPGRRRDGRRLHELGRRLRDPLHPRDRGRGHPPALARGAGRPRRRPRARARPRRGRRRRSPPGSTRRPATASATSSRPARSTSSSRT